MPEDRIAVLEERISEIEKIIQTPIDEDALKKIIVGIIKDDAVEEINYY